jgi:gluconolactonase
LPEIIAEGFGWSEGPLWLAEQDILIFSDIPKNAVFQWSEQDGLKLYLKLAGYTDTISRGGETGSNGLLLDNKGGLILCQHGDRRIARMDAPLDKPEPKYITLVDKWQGRRLNSPNDAVYNKRGDLFFTDPPYGMEKGFEDPERELDFTGVYKLTAEGELILLTDKITAPNGIGLSPDKADFMWQFGNGRPGILDGIQTQEGRIREMEGYFCARRYGSYTGVPDGEGQEDGVIFATDRAGCGSYRPAGAPGNHQNRAAHCNCALDDESGIFTSLLTCISCIRLKRK